MNNLLIKDGSVITTKFVYEHSPEPDHDKDSHNNSSLEDIMEQSLPDSSGSQLKSTATARARRRRAQKVRVSVNSAVRDWRNERQRRQSQHFTSKSVEADVGEEPGIDIDTTSVVMPDSMGSHVIICDYSPQKFKKTHYDIQRNYNSIITGSTDRTQINRLFTRVLEERQPWVKVRWIVVNGMSWEALRPIAELYRLHPLAIEDMLDIPQRIKLEVYDDQIFCCFPLHVMVNTDTPFTWKKRQIRHIILFLYSLYSFLKNISLFRRFKKDDSEKFKPSFEPHQKDYENNESDDNPKECELFYTSADQVICLRNSPILEKLSQLPARSMYDWTCGNHILRQEALQNMQIPGTAKSIEINVEQVCVFMEKDTVITFFEKSLESVFVPIVKRLRCENTLLRSSSDPSILVQAIFDANVDLFGPILNEYRYRLSGLQLNGVQRPNMHTIRSLHSFMTDLALLRTPLDGISNLVEGFGTRSMTSNISTHQDDTKRMTRDSKRVSVPENTITAPSVYYFNDVADHTLSYLHDLDTMRSQSQMLSSLIFNTISIKAGDSVKILSLIAIVVLPMTFLHGYYGMNFKSFSSLDQDVSHYWMIGTPATLALMAFLVYPIVLSYLKDFFSWASNQI